MNNSIIVSIIIPCRNEEKFIVKCLDSIIAQDYPKDLIEIFIIDGISKDNTRKIVKEYNKKYPFIVLLNNSKKVTPIAMNIGVKRARGDIITFLGAYSIYSSNYIEKLVLGIRKYEADCIGGVFITKVEAETMRTKAITLAFFHPFVVENFY